MKIVAIRSFIKHMALKKPYTIAYNTYSDVSIVFTEIKLDNGIIGIGSASPAEDVVGESPIQTLANLESDFVQQLIGRDIRCFHKIIAEVQQHFHHLPGTQAALDIALHDAFGKWAGISVAEFYGIQSGPLKTSVTIGIKNTAETLAEAADYFSQGFDVFKIKTGLDIEEDIERVLLLHEKYGKKIKIRVDANQGYTLSKLTRFIKATENTSLELIEQPLTVGKETDLLLLDQSKRNRLAADESLHNAKAAIDLASVNHPFGIYNIKLMKCGGIIGAREIANIAKPAGINLFWGCNDESIISITAALHIAYSCPHTRYLDLDGSFDLAEDMVKGGFEIKNGLLMLNQQPGFGYEWI
ncbi:mandelate racemase/muconate lactonizing enzyme family protein [Sediminibacterium sp.]|uniref:mandelate racemase/muconate lactonizing enzyme family protein n=1 Tax=Sediminibacterium sp. TaxID=1917865 RepID=UPI003F71C2B8